jgi:hypothetical protein
MDLRKDYGKKFMRYYDPYYYVRSITKEELGAESNRRDMAILEINQLANIQLDAEARAYGSEDLNNLREEIIDQINKEGEIFFVSTQDGIELYCG